MMQLEVLKYLYYYEVPTVIFCQDDRQNNFIFILMNDETYEYIGKKVSVEELNQFLEGQMDLRPIYVNRETNMYIGKYKRDKFYAHLYQGPYGENLLPADGLMLINTEKDLATALKNNIVNKLMNGSTQSKVGQSERDTQKRLVSLFQNELKYRYLGNWSNRDNNSNVEEPLLSDWLLNTQKYPQNIVSKAVATFTKATSKQGNLYEINKDVYNLLRYGVTVQSEVGQG